jgi:hypothetical protein
LSVFVRLVKVFDARDLRHLAFCDDWVADRQQTFELDLQKALNDVVLFDGRNFDSDLNLSLFSFSDFEPDLFEVLKPLIASD